MGVENDGVAMLCYFLKGGMPDVIHLNKVEHIWAFTRPEIIYEASKRTGINALRILDTLLETVITLSLEYPDKYKTQIPTSVVENVHFADRYAALDPKSYQQFQDSDLFPTPFGVLSNAADSVFFDVGNKRKAPTKKSGLRVGWIGNQFQTNSKQDTFFQSVITPLQQYFSDNAAISEFKTFDISASNGDRQSIADFYRDIDVLILGPKPPREQGLVLVAMAAGLPILTQIDSDYPSFFGAKQTGLSVANGNVDDYKSALIACAEDVTSLVDIQQENIEAAKEHTVPKVSDLWSAMWQNACDEHSQSSYTFYKKMALKEKYKNWHAKHGSDQPAGAATFKQPASNRMRYFISDWISAKPGRKAVYTKTKSIFGRG
jgi:hypothetical protein